MIAASPNPHLLRGAARAAVTGRVRIARRAPMLGRTVRIAEIGDVHEVAGRVETRGQRPGGRARATLLPPVDVAARPLFPGAIFVGGNNPTVWTVKDAAVPDAAPVGRPARLTAIDRIGPFDAELGAARTTEVRRHGDRESATAVPIGPEVRRATLCLRHAASVSRKRLRDTWPPGGNC